MSNEVVLIHHIEGTAEDSLWSLNWTTTNDICGEEFFTDRGSFSSPNYPNSYDENRRCVWTIEVSGSTSKSIWSFLLLFKNIENFQVNPKYAVTLKFKDWDLRSSQGCSQHFVQIFDGKFDYSPAITDKLWFGRTYIYVHIYIFLNR